MLTHLYLLFLLLITGIQPFHLPRIGHLLLLLLFPPPFLLALLFTPVIIQLILNCVSLRRLLSRGLFSHILSGTHRLCFVLASLLVLLYLSKAPLLSLPHVLQPTVVSLRIIVWVPGHDLKHRGLSVSRYVAHSVPIHLRTFAPLSPSHPTSTLFNCMNISQPKH